MRHASFLFNGHVLTVEGRTNLDSCMSYIWMRSQFLPCLSTLMKGTARCLLVQLFLNVEIWQCKGIAWGKLTCISTSHTKLQCR